MFPIGRSCCTAKGCSQNLAKLPSPITLVCRSLSSKKRFKCLHPINIITVASTTLVLSSAYIYKQIQQIGQTLDNLIPDIIKAHQPSYVVPPEDIINIDEVKKPEQKWLSFRRKDWDSWRHFHGHNFWLLARLTQSEHQKTRRFIIAALAGIKNWPWSDAEYQMIAQVIDDRTKVGLAHSANVDLRFFLSPPSIPPTVNSTSIEDGLKDLLSSLPQESLDACGRYFMQRALPKFITPKTETVWTHCEFGGEFLETHPVERSLKQRFLLYLQVLLNHSKIPEHCRNIVKNRGLLALRRVYDDQKDNRHVVYYVGKILANLSLYEDLHPPLIQAGWVTIFAKWMQGNDLQLNLLATKALINLDKDYDAPHGVMQDGVYQYHPHSRSRSPAHVDIIFIPGLLGGPVWTWRQKDNSAEAISKCWPKDWLAKDCPNARILTVEFDTNLSTWSTACPHDHDERTLKARSLILLNKLREAGVGDRPIIWVGHSMGGLLIKSILAQSEAESLTNATKGIIFFSVPHKGSDMASWVADSSYKYILFPSTEVRELIRGSRELQTLHSLFKSVVSTHDIPVLSFGEGSPMKISLRKNGVEWIETLLVPPESSNPEVGTFKLMNDLNHLTICKPASRSSALYQNVLSFIFNCDPVLAVHDVLQRDIFPD